MKLQVSVMLTAVISCAGLCAQGTTLYIFPGDSAFDRLGRSVSGAGDVDADGYDDLIVGGFEDDDSALDPGIAMVYSGRTGATLYRFVGDSAGDWFGGAVSGAGDVDGDGHADLIVGALLDDNAGSETGSATVFSGKTGAIIYALYGEGHEDRFGCAVSAAGDVNGDGYDDFIVGAYADDDAGPDSGSATVFSGRNGQALHRFLGQNPYDRLGWSVSGGGDLDDDGFDDCIVGAPQADGSYYLGSVRALSGKTGDTLHTFYGIGGFGWSVGDAGDVNSDGHDDIIIGAPQMLALTGRAEVYCGETGGLLYAYSGDALNDGFGSSVCGARDVDGDGYDDFIVGASSGYVGAMGNRVVVYSGRDGLPVLDHVSASGIDDFGAVVGGAGDVNGDGYYDVIVGAQDDDLYGTLTGSATVFSLGLTGTPPRMRTFGTACSGCLGCLPHIDYSGRAAIGESIDFGLRGGSPLTFSFLVIAAPEDYHLGDTFVGLTGCMLYVEAVNFSLQSALTNVHGQASTGPIQVPNDPGLVGWSLNAQWVIRDIMANPFGATTSNGLSMVIGN